MHSPRIDLDGAEGSKGEKSNKTGHVEVRRWRTAE